MRFRRCASPNYISVGHYRVPLRWDENSRRNTVEREIRWAHPRLASCDHRTRGCDGQCERQMPEADPASSPAEPPKKTECYNACWMWVPILWQRISDGDTQLCLVTLTMTRCVVAAQTPPVMASKPCWMLITRLPSIGGTSIHSPSLFNTSKPPVLSCDRNVNRPAESLWGPTPCESGSDGGYLTNFSRLMFPLNSSKVFSGSERHSATKCMKLWAKSSTAAIYLSTRCCAPG